MNRIETVGYVVNCFPKVSETFISNELARLKEMGIRVRVLSLRRPEESIVHPVVRRAGLDLCTEYSRAAFEQWVSDERPDVLHAHFATEPTQVVRDIGARHGVPYTFTAHGYDVYRRPPADFADRAHGARAVVTVSRANARHLCQQFGVPPSHVHIIPCGVDVDAFRPAAATCRDRVPWIVCVARAVPVKNLDVLLEACKALRERDVTFRCAVIGDGRKRQCLAARSERLGLTETVTFYGSRPQDEVVRWWQRAAVGVLTSDSEGMPVCLMEAAACGVPVVATDVGGVRELVDNGRTGFVVPTRDPQAAAASIEALLLDPVAHRTMARAARQRAEQHFSLNLQCHRLLGMWSEIVSTKIAMSDIVPVSGTG